MAAAGGLGPVAVALVGLGEEVYLMAVLRSDGVGCDWKRVGFDGGEAV